MLCVFPHCSLQSGAFNCILLAARNGHRQLFHHLVEKHGANPRQKDKRVTVGAWGGGSIICTFCNTFGRISQLCQECLDDTNFKGY